MILLKKSGHFKTAMYTGKLGVREGGTRTHRPREDKCKNPENILRLPAGLIREHLSVNRASLQKLEEVVIFSNALFSTKDHKFTKKQGNMVQSENKIYL